MAETNEMWMSQKDHPTLQLGSYYNVPGQTLVLPICCHTLAMHGSFSAALAAIESPHMQFQGLYFPARPVSKGKPQHLASSMAGNIGVGVSAAAGLSFSCGMGINLSKTNASDVSISPS